MNVPFRQTLALSVVNALMVSMGVIAWPPSRRWTARYAETARSHETDVETTCAGEMLG